MAAHEDKCICGQCQCPRPCKFKDCSRGCLIKCQFKAGHEGEHICNSKHFCKQECWLKSTSKKCEGFCSHQIVNATQKHSNHICNIPTEKHGCNGICSHFNNSRNCKQFCSREVNHSGKHLCEINISQHLCKNMCSLSGNSLNCKQICTLPFNHKGNHICEIGQNNHLCNKKCSLFECSRSGCDENCNLKAGHSGNCLCKNSWKIHICNDICNLFDKSKGCKKYCILMSRHEGEHQCEISIDKHICKGTCSLKGKTLGKCYESCCLPYGHNGDCICKKETELDHLCDKECNLFNKTKNCKHFCNKKYGHIGEHLCSLRGQHTCLNKCYYTGKCKGKCDAFCKLEYGHKNKCNCNIVESPDYHLCNKNCAYFEKSRGCNKECVRKYGHEGLCKCIVNEEFHFCISKCELCENTECGHVSNHEKKDSNIKCCKCKDQICYLTGQKRLPMSILLL